MTPRLTKRRPRPILYNVEPLGLPVRPNRGIRNTDQHGSGVWWASRDSGNRHHLGADFIALPGDDVLSPVDGTVRRLGYAYDGEEYRLVVIVGRAKHEGVECRLLYVDPFVTAGQRVSVGQVIGRAQDIAAKYPAITPHVHTEVWVAHSPADMMPHAPARNVDA